MFSRLFGSNASSAPTDEPSLAEVYQYVASQYTTHVKAPYGLSSDVLSNAGYSDDKLGHTAIVMDYMRQPYDQFLSARRACLLSLSRSAGHALRTNDTPLEGKQDYDHPRAFKNSNLAESKAAYLEASVSFAHIQDALSTLYHIDRDAYEQTRSAFFDEDTIRADASITPVTLQDIVQTRSDLKFWSQRIESIVRADDDNPSLTFQNGVEVTTNLQMYYDELSCLHTNIGDMIASVPERPLRFDPAPDVSGHDI